MVKFEHNSHLVLVCLLLTLSREMPAVLYIAGIMVIAKSHFEKESSKAKKIKQRSINWKI